MALLLKGAPVAEKLTENTAARADALREKGIIPTLAIVRLGQRSDDISYERGAVKRCSQSKIEVRLHTLPENTVQEELISLINDLNVDNSVHGVLIMRPLPGHIDDGAVTKALSPQKDMDGITVGAMASVYTGAGEGYAPCTAQACVEILKHYNIPLEGKRAVVLGRSLVIGKPVSQLLLKENMTITTCHSKSENLPKICREADVVIAAAGKKKMLTADFISQGQTVIDVGIHVGDDGKLCGDVDTEQIMDKAAAVTPVPGGVGAVTTSVLASHVVDSAECMYKKEI